jgi:hypothetical protein
VLEPSSKGLEIGKPTSNPHPKNLQIKFTMSKLGLDVLKKRTTQH